MVGPTRPQFVLFGSSIVQLSFSHGGWGAILSDIYSRKVFSLCLSIFDSVLVFLSYVNNMLSFVNMVDQPFWLWNTNIFLYVKKEPILVGAGYDSYEYICFVFVKNLALMGVLYICILCFYELLRKRGSCNCNPTSWIWMRFSGVQFEVMKNLHFTNHLYCTSYFSVIQKKKYKQTICGWLWILNKLIRVGHVYPISISLSYICLKCS